MGTTSDIDRLIELGLNRYGAGDLDGALLMWEEALAIDPDNAQANSYVDYVRLNYELLSANEPSVDESLDAKFAIEEEPEYQIEIIMGRESEPELTTPQKKVELPQAAALVALDAVDAGWDIEETQDTSTAFPGASTPDHAEAAPTEDAPLELELEAEAPPARDPVNFEDSTREFHGVAQSLARPIVPMPNEEFNSDQYTGGFNQPQATPAGFGTEETSVRKRDLGFVQPTKPAPDPDLELGQYDATLERKPDYAGGEHGDNGADQGSDEDLINSLPTPRTPEESGEIRLPTKPSGSTRDMPAPVRQPAARRDSEALSQAAEVMLSHAPTREVSVSSVPTREMSVNEIRARTLEPLVTAPTRELGLRPPKLTNPEDVEDQPTGQSDARAIRSTRQPATHADRPATEGTRQDIVLPFDPIAAQSAQILDDVDAGAPPGEPADERTRRRITRLLELAADWSDNRELDKAVSAVDLALSEDPNSALGQKLITRNKDLIMSLFQSYLGDLDRMPQLAKPLHELANAPISPRAAFLLSRIDGTLTIDELLDVSGMPRLEAYRHLCQLYLRGILR